MQAVRTAAQDLCMHDETDHYAVERQVSSALVGVSSAKGFAALQTPNLRLCIHSKLNPICMGSMCVSGQYVGRIWKKPRLC